MGNNREITQLGGQSAEGDLGSAKASGHNIAYPINDPRVGGKLLSAWFRSLPVGLPLGQSSGVVSRKDRPGLSGQVRNDIRSIRRRLALSAGQFPDNLVIHQLVQRKKSTHRGEISGETPKLSRKNNSPAQRIIGVRPGFNNLWRKVRKQLRDQLHLMGASACPIPEDRKETSGTRPCPRAG